VASLGTRGVSKGRHPEKDPLSPIPNGQNGWLEGVRLAEQHKREEKMGPYRKSRIKTDSDPDVIPTRLCWLDRRDTADRNSQAVPKLSAFGRVFISPELKIVRDRM
jgi:hypothetical protein